MGDGRELRKLQPLPYQRADLGFVSLPLHGIMLAFGGGAQYPAYNETVIYDPIKDAWEISRSVLIDGSGRNRAGSAVLTKRGESGTERKDEWVITTGGYSLDPFFEPMASTECFSANAHSWVQNASSQTSCLTVSLP